MKMTILVMILLLKIPEHLILVLLMKNCKWSKILLDKHNKL